MKEQVIVMGGGVIGLSCAFELRRRGYEVTVLEINRCGGQASGAAAGMLAPYSENVEGPDAFFQLCLESLRLYPEWQADVKKASGQSFEYTNSGSLYAAYHDADLLALEGRLHWQRQHGSSGRIVEGVELQRLEPHLAKNVRAALFTPEESHLYAPHYVKALEEACRLMGVQIHEQLEQLAVTEWQHEVRVIAEDGRVFGGDRLVVCSGAWAQELEGTFGIRIPVYPIRGQICAYEVDGTDGAQPVQHMVFCNQGYLVAKENGTLVCGASEDVAGFDTSVTDRGIERLRKWNKQLFPDLEHRVPFHRWAGLRPSTQDGFPLLGPLSASDRVIMAAGHYRNGILLSPATAMYVADCLDGKQTVERKRAFSPERFGLLASYS
ncbi:glycine oxidase ThiO [Paenibacillus sp. OV219]|uniref:glycine oxidase ThiO n=1 Tax=Paenibacillus sp. OV219 TaxID=1884377 RepID=UPI0008D23287|nr:glycine oxidase ThiO [Paenibacillus sp. OV219]SEO97636.1 glycine oxidase [Paenibacillus sp. OV219]